MTLMTFNKFLSIPILKNSFQFIIVKFCYLKYLKSLISCILVFHTPTMNDLFSKIDQTLYNYIIMVITCCLRENFELL